MLFILFTSFVVSEKGICYIKRSKQHQFLSSYGFRSNSNFSYEIYTIYPIKLNLFLLSGAEFYQPTLRYLYRTCNNTSIQISILNQSYNTPKTVFKWNGHIDKKDVYYPLILICSKNRSKLEVHYKYSNEISLIDFRNDSNSKIYLIFSLLHLFLGILWLFNTFIKTEFSIPLQQFISLLPLLRAVSNSLIASEWEKKKYKDELTIYETTISMIFTSSFYIIFMCTTTLAFSGWCIFRKIELIEKVQLFLSSFFIVAGYDIEKFDNNNFYATIFKIIGLFWYLKINVDYLTVSLMIPESSFSTEKMRLKIKMVQNFNLTFFVIFLFTGLIEYCAKYVGVQEIVCDSIFEIGILILEIVEIYFFFLRDKFNGLDDINYRNDCLPLLLIEPQKRQYVFVIKNDLQE